MSTSRFWPPRATTIACFVCASPLIAYVAFTMALFLPAKAKADRENERRGAQIVEALERYRGGNGKYPRALQALAPEWIGALPKPVNNTGEERYEDFSYAWIDSGAAFRLGFPEAPMMPMDDMAGQIVWDSRARTWDTVLPGD